MKTKKMLAMFTLISCISCSSSLIYYHNFNPLNGIEIPTSGYGIYDFITNWIAFYSKIDNNKIEMKYGVITKGALFEFGIDTLEISQEDGRVYYNGKYSKLMKNKNSIALMVYKGTSFWGLKIKDENDITNEKEHIQKRIGILKNINQSNIDRYIDKCIW